MPKETMGGKDKVELYGLKWEPLIPPVQREIYMIQKGGRWIKRTGGYAGEGLLFHYRRLQELLWPQKEWHKWNELLLSKFVTNRFIGIMGPASSGKTHEAGLWGLCNYYCFPDQTTILCSSTERDRLEERVWGEIKKYHKMARARFEWLPGQLIESRQRIVTDERYVETEGRDFRNGLCGLPCKKGGAYVGMGCFPPETLVDTPFGAVPISSVMEGDLVLSAIGPSRVIACSIRSADRLVRIHLSNGAPIDCTPEHPILTNAGWVNAIDLSPQHYVVSTDEAMSALRRKSPNQAEEPHVLLQNMQGQWPLLNQNLCGLRKADSEVASWIEGGKASMEILFHEMQENHMEKAMPSMRQNLYPIGAASHFLQQVLRSELENDATAYSSENESFSFNAGLEGCRIESEQSNHGGSKGTPAQKKHYAKTTSRYTSKPNSRWSRSRTDQSRRYLDSVVSGSYLQLLRSNRKVFKAPQYSTLLSRFGVARDQVSSGNRWEIPHNGATTFKGSNKGQVFKRSRVVRVEVLEQSSDSRYRKGGDGYQVYNLEVEGHPSYSVNGVLVHNSFVGIKNKRVILIADEGQFMPKAYVDSISNLNKNAGFQCVVMGNPKDTTDALGMICEPSAELGGWDGGIDQTGGTKEWPTRFPGGVCIQLVGSDSPNMDFPEDQPPRYPFLITREAINNDIAFYGKDSLQFSMMNDGRMPRGQGLRRVITRQMCLKFGAMEDPVWVGEKRTKIGFLDAAYGSVGGDRCVFGELQFGPGIDKEGRELTLLAVIGTMLVPVSIKENELPEDQIARFVKEQCELRGITPENFGFDSTGRGSLMGAFARLWSAYVVPIEFGGKASLRPVSVENPTLCKDFYSKFVSELWWTIRLAIESRQFRGMTEDLMQEGTQREWKLVTGNRVEVETKEEMKEKMGRSPDLFDGLVTGVELARRRGFMIAKLGRPRVVADEDWQAKLREKAERLARAGGLNYAA
jgi:hypothetical protein